MRARQPPEGRRRRARHSGGSRPAVGSIPHTLRATTPRPTHATAQLSNVLAASVAAAILGVLCLPGAADAYGWPVKPFDKPHPIRGAFDDPRFHLGAESALSAFHFGVDIAAPDGTPVYSVSPGYVRMHAGDVTIRRPATGRAYGYWHVTPVVHTGEHVRLHQLLGFVASGWGHVHFAESVNGRYENPLRLRALTPFYDRTKPTVGGITLISTHGATVDPQAVRGVVGVEAEIFDTPPLAPPAPWQVARLTPALVWWRLSQGGTPVTTWKLSIDFNRGLLPSGAYNGVYAPGTYQNKANRPGHYLFWVLQAIDTATLADGVYTIDIVAADTHYNLGEASLDFAVVN
jgi:murein DD-endopeptidase MepM/ murein hydrolase activator NlpD